MNERNNSTTNEMCNDTSTCVHTKKVYGSCKDKECLENLRVYLTQCGQNLVNGAANIKCQKAEVIWVYTDIEPVPFNRGYYTVDLRFFFKITLDVSCNLTKPTRIEGLAVYDKKVVLFGSEGNAKIFSSKYKFDETDTQFYQKNNLPVAQVDVFDINILNLSNFLTFTLNNSIMLW